MTPPHKARDFVEIYHSGSAMAAQKVVDVVLAPEGVEVLLHDRQDTAFPSVAQPGGVYLAVPEDQREKAVALLTEALENGYLDDEDGELV